MPSKTTLLHRLVLFSTLVGAGFSIAGCRPAPSVSPSPASVRHAAPAVSPATTPTPGTTNPMANHNTPTAFDSSKLGTVERDITYCHAANVALKMDVYYPAKANAAAWPAIVFVHGGAWMSGDKATTDGLRDIPEMVRRGYLVASVNYRLAPQFQFPAQIEDVKCAVRYLRAHAATYHFDPSRLGAWGASAGGHLVALLGLTDDKLWIEPNGEYADQTSRIQAVVDLYGPSDMTQVFPGASGLIDERVFGAVSKRDRRLAAASPVTYISPGAPPFLLIHGDQDDLVPLSQSEELYGRLKEASISVQLVVVKNAGHVFAPVDGKAIDPSRARITQITADFFDSVLK